MSQTSYGLTMARGLPGMKADNRMTIVETLIAAVIIPLARAVFAMYGYERQGRLPVSNQVVITDNAGTFTEGSISTVINGGTPVTTAWVTDKNATLTAHALALSLLTDVLSCVYASGTHTITLIMKNTHLATSVTTLAALGTGTITISSEVISTTDTAAKCRGIALNPGTLIQDSTGLVQYAVNDAVSVLTAGAIYVLPEEAVTTDDTVYVRLVDGGAGKPVGGFGKSSDSGKCVTLPGAKWIMGGSTTVVAVLSINLPQ